MNLRHVFAALTLSAVAGAASGPAVADDDFRACLARLQPEASASGVQPAAWKRYTADLAPDREVVGFLDRQPEFKTPIWDYLAALVDEERVAQGQARLRDYATVLREVERRYGVDPATVVAVWGVESNYGQNLGGRPLLQSLGTLACYGRRQSFFRGEFFSSLRILQDGHVPVEKLNGSWAGAFGQTQFMPSTFLRTAVDFDGDGRRDVVDNAADALGSTANYLKKAGWQSGRGWGFEVVLPRGMDVSAESRLHKRSLAEWAARGVRRADGAPLEGSDNAGLLVPAKAAGGGPAFLVTRNFDALYAYNAAESYALTIAHLADRLRGGGAFHTDWPTDDLGLSRAQRRELQGLLRQRGHDVGEADGLIGERTRKAIMAEQQRLGLAPDGRAGQKLLARLRAGG